MSQPNLLSWAEEHISNLYTATTKADFETAFDALIAPKVQIVMNGKQLTRDEYKRQLYDEEREEPRGVTNVKFNATLVISSLDDIFPQAGSVGLFYTVNISRRDGVSEAITSSINMTVQREALHIGPLKPGDHLRDDRRATAVNQLVSTEFTVFNDVAHA